MTHHLLHTPTRLHVAVDHALRITSRLTTCLQDHAHVGRRLAARRNLALANGAKEVRFFGFRGRGELT